MNLLAIDTCFDACSVAAGRRLRSLIPSIAFATEPMATGHAERLMPMIEAVMADAGMAFHELQRIAIANGPGTFTGARIAVSTARALSLATGAQVVAITSLQLMAMNPSVVAGGAKTIAIASDARRGEVYFQRFDAHSLKALAPAALLSIEAAGQALGGALTVVAGSGAASVADAATALGRPAQAIRPGLVPEAIDMLFASVEFPVGLKVAPLYLRAPDAKPPAPNPLFDMSLSGSAA
ncbi:MAG: tRNA (adenosine(37)-N6)-threonylcarbamoyltransferase complex dimerization subunit type 1 TsaB [Hyphomicrobium sp.]|nr:tRNA (adenosine(37)-N6)-threonylcarbamoyltransferase complex dimerization subunit type 1 TsaB [Hyphomicrobium sp.]